VLDAGDRPGISVVIPTLCRPTLERAVASAAGQRERPNEIIVVANGNEALAAARIRRLSEMAGEVPIRAVSLPPYSGPSICRNVGAWQSVSAYVAFLDDDDEFAPTYLAMMQQRIDSARPHVVYGAKVWRNPDGSVRKEKRLGGFPRERLFEAMYRQENPGAGGQNVVVDREKFFDLGGFPVDLPSGEDRAFAMAALNAGLDVDYVEGAEVWCHDPEGYRAKLRSDKWATDLKLIHKYWGTVGWGARSRSLWRVARSFLHSTRRQWDR
jgi:glycosyltransferase involved in cell wall biosynthesis